jgi:type I restriction enzyme R subunit
MPTDTTEAGLESLIFNSMTDAGWIAGNHEDYNREYAVDLKLLSAFILATQKEQAEYLDLGNEGPTRQKFLARLQGEITKRGVIDVLRKPVKHGPVSLDLFYGTPSPGNTKAAGLFTANRFSITRQLQYSKDGTRLSLDLCLFINGLPIATFELKNNLTKQTVEDAVEQYCLDRGPNELLFQFGRCIVHFAVDDLRVKMCTQLKGKASWFLPFDKGYDDGAGNPPNPDGIETDYLWKQFLTPQGLTDIIENYAQIVEEKDDRTGKLKRKQIFPRYHQLDVVHKLLEDVRRHGVGHRYLIQHSAGSGKSNSIAWLAHQLIGERKDDTTIFDSIIIVTDRRILDKQINDTIKQFAQVSSIVGHAERAGDLKKFITDGKKIIISTVQKFPVIFDEISNEHRGRRFAIIIDEAHSSQGGRTSAKMSMVLSENGAESDEETIEDTINRLMESRKMLTNASYFAFTATPKNRTLEIFGEPFKEGEQIKHRPFHCYTMKQAIQEGFILDVLKAYTPIQSYYRLIKTIESDPEFDTRKASKKLRKYVESSDHAIQEKAEIMVDHFHDQVIGLRKINGQARAMVITTGIERAIQYYFAFCDYLIERKSPYKAIVAFSGEHEFRGNKVSESSLNGFSSNVIADRIQEEPYRFLICADKFQTGYDEPLLHTMYVDKHLSGIKAVQTLSRLNRAWPGKYDVFVLDFMNDTETIKVAFSDYYRTTILSEETDPNKLHDLQADLDNSQVYVEENIDNFVELYLRDAERDKLDPILDGCVANYIRELDEDHQVDFKGNAKAFTRIYGFLASILPYPNTEWEKLSIFLNFLIPKLPAPREDDLSKGILETIDLESYRVEKKTTMAITLLDIDGEIHPIPPIGSGRKASPAMDKLSNIVKTFNDIFGNIPWTDGDRVRRLITEEIPRQVSADAAYQNAQKNSDKQNARIEHDKALERVMTAVLNDDAELFKQFSDNESFRKWLLDNIFALTYKEAES